MTLLEITYELQSPLSLDQLRRLGEFANTYGLRKFHVDEQRNHLTFEYDASRLGNTRLRTCSKVRWFLCSSTWNFRRP